MVTTVESIEVTAVYNKSTTVGSLAALSTLQELDCKGTASCNSCVNAGVMVNGARSQRKGGLQGVQAAGVRGTQNCRVQKAHPGGIDSNAGGVFHMGGK